MPKRKTEDEDEWAQRRDEILDLYKTKDKSLTDVMRIEASRGFKRTYVGVRNVWAGACSSPEGNLNTNGNSRSGKSARMFETRSGSSSLPV
jgi:hypothetical protein